VKALAALPDDTVINGELVALDKHGRLRRWSRDLKCGSGADTNEKRQPVGWPPGCRLQYQYFCAP